MSRLIALLGMVAFPVILGAQTPDATAEPRFEAATLKINKSGEARGQISAVPESGRLTVTNSRVNDLIQSAYGLQLPTQLVNVPDWARSTRVDVIAKAENPAPLGVLQRMLLPLLEETLRLSVHRDTREMDAFALVLANRDGRLGPNLKKTAADCGNALGTTMQFNRVTPASTSSPACGIQAADGPGRIVAIGVDIAAIAALIAPSQRAVIDRTGLSGRFDINLTYTPEAFTAASLAARNGAPMPGVDPNGPSLVTALEQQAGLWLQPIRAPIEVVVIDSIERPSE
jgi:uncharacterized protein (TIGR03435 family)